MKRLAVALTRLYPASWRERYGEEFVALLEQCEPRASVVANTAVGALGAWLRWPAAAGSASARLRGALTAVLWGGLAVLAEASGFVKAEIPATRPSVRLVGSAMVAAAIVAAVVMAAGAVGPALAVTRLAIARRRFDVLRLVAAPPLAGAAFVGLVWALGLAVRQWRPQHAAGHALFYVFAAAFLAAAVITGRAPSLALRRLDPGAAVLRVSAAFGLVAVAALATASGLALAYTVMLARYEPQLAHSPYGPPLPMLSLLGQLVAMTVVMALGTALAGTGLARGTLRRGGGHPAGGRRAEPGAHPAGHQPGGPPAADGRLGGAPGGA